MEKMSDLESRLEIAERNRDAARENFLTMQQTAAKLLEDCEAYKAEMKRNFERATSLSVKLALAEDALEPFAKASMSLDEAALAVVRELPKDNFLPKTYFTHKHLRAARSALPSTPLGRIEWSP